MKSYLLPLLLLATVVTSCNSQPNAYKKAKETEKAIKQAPRPGTVPTTSGGWPMTAKVDGKTWTALSIMPPSQSSRIIGYIGETSYMAIPSFQKQYAKVGKKNKIGDSYAAEVWTNGDGNIYNKQSGIVEITKMDGDWVEGSFSFTDTSEKAGKTITVTDGFFRVQL